MAASTTLPLNYPVGQSLPSISLSVRQIIDVLRTFQTDAQQAADIAALEVAVAQLEVDLAALEALIGSGGGLTLQQLFELSLVTRADQILGSFTNIREREQTSRERDADATIAALINGNRNTTGLKQEVRVRIEEDLALAETIDSVSADLALTNAQVVELTQTVADGDTALAAQITAVQTSVAGNTSSVHVLTESVNGINSRWGVNLNAQDEVIGSIRLDGSPAGSVFGVNVDYFYVGKTGTTGGTPVPVFAIQTVDGDLGVALRGNLIADGTITAAKVGAGEIDAGHINVATLSALSANLGTVTSGLIRNAADTLRFDLPNMRLYRTDGTMELNFNSKTFRIVF